MLYIYVLELESNKYYIGKTTNPAFKLENHFDGGNGVSMQTCIKDFEQFEFEINKKMEIITDKIIKINENKNKKL